MTKVTRNVVIDQIKQQQRNPNRLSIISHLLVFHAQLVESVDVPLVKSLHHASQPGVGASVEHTQDRRRQLERG